MTLFKGMNVVNPSAKSHFTLKTDEHDNLNAHWRQSWKKEKERETKEKRKKDKGKKRKIKKEKKSGLEGSKLDSRSKGSEFKSCLVQY